MSREVLNSIINPALDRLATAAPAYRIPVSAAARVMLLAIGYQESNLTDRFQISVGNDGSRFRGPARGLWQFELGGGVAGVMNHSASADRASAFTADFIGSNTTNTGAIWASLAYEDILAAVFARLLLWTDPAPLPTAAASSEQTAWQYYLRNWRPGRPRQDKWRDSWGRALDLVVSSFQA
jgi:hypothetical protein